MPTLVPSGSSSILLMCRSRISRRKHRHKHSFLLSFEERQDYWVNSSKLCMLDSLQCHKLSFRQLQYYQVSLFQHSRSMLAKEQHQLQAILGRLRQHLVPCTSRSCLNSLQTRCISSNHHRRNLVCSSCNRRRMRRSSPRLRFTSTTGYLPHHRRRTQAATRRRRPQVNTNLRPLPHTNPVNVRRLMRLTVSTSAPPKSGRPKALTQRHRPQHRHHNPIHHRPSRMYRRHRHQRPDDEDMPEPIQMHLHEVQRVL